MGVYPRIEVQRFTGEEQFQKGSEEAGFSLLEFWQWMGSDLISKTFRGVVAEYIVAQAMGIADGARTDWDPYDLTTLQGRKLEIKSSAYLQSWHQDKLTAPTFTIKATKNWDADTGSLSSNSSREAEIYVFCLLHHKEQETPNPMDMDQLTFYVVSRKTIEEIAPNGKKLSLSALLKLNPEQADFESLKSAIDNVTC